MAQLETFFDSFLVEEIPVKEAMNTGIVGKDGELVRTEKQARKPQYGKIISCGAKFPRNGVIVPNPYHVGDVVKTSEFGRDYQTFSVEDEKPGATKFYLIRFDDIQGKVLDASHLS
jgi:co-chaperonin GroES (HSP10)